MTASLPRIASWAAPRIPVLPGRGPAPRLHDTASGGPKTASVPEGAVAGIYVCGITPYDATHLGHAATYLAFDTIQRVWLDAGYAVNYAQNVTDVDDPLLERAAATGADWRELAESQVELFRTDMAALEIRPPESYVAVTDMIAPVAEAVGRLVDSGLAYSVPTPDSLDREDVYFDIAAAERLTPWALGAVSGLTREQMAPLFAERGGDPDRPGKRDPLDPLLWRAERAADPAWDSPVGRGRPGWHIECSVIALEALGAHFAVQGGGGDLPFPHHEFSAAHATALSGEPLAGIYSHAGLVAYEGEKMSKSLGNLVLVSRLRERGVEPAAIRLAILAHHYREDWEWTEAGLEAAQGRLAAWRAAVSGAREASASATAGATLALLAEVRSALAEDLDTARALELIDAGAAASDDPALLVDLVRALLGVAL